jgi:hypothetical protein
MAIWDNTSWGVHSYPKDAIPKIQENLNVLYDSIGGSPDFAKNITNSIATKAPLIHNQAWSTITGAPTTLAGYGITDAYTKSASDGKYAPADYGLGSYCKKVQDVNTAVLSGWHCAAALALNVPEGVTLASYLFVEALDSENIKQTFFSRNNGAIYIRSMQSQVWKPWAQIATTTHFDYSAEITATDWNTLIKNGKYYVIGASALAINGPLPAGDTNHIFYVDVINGTAGRTSYVSQQATNVVTGNLYTRKNQGGTWSAWKQIVTADNPVFSGNLTVDRNVAGSNVLGYFNNGDYTAGNKSIIKVRQQVTPTSSWAALLGVDRDTGNVFLTNDDITKQHISISPAGNVTFSGVVKATSPVFDGALKANNPSFTNVTMLMDNTASTQLLINGPGSNWGTIQSDASNKWSLGYKTVANNTLGTPVISWGVDGNVGMGTISPSTCLDVRGNCPSAPINNGYVACFASYAFGYGVLLGSNTQNGYGAIQGCQGSNISNLLLNPSGKNVGIGIANPQATLHSAGSTILGLAPALTFYTSGMSANQMGFYLDEASNGFCIPLRLANGTLKTIKINYATGAITVA